MNEPLPVESMTNDELKEKHLWIKQTLFGYRYGSCKGNEVLERLEARDREILAELDWRKRT